MRDAGLASRGDQDQEALDTGIPPAEPALARGGEDQMDGRLMGSLVHRCLEHLPLDLEPPDQDIKEVLARVLGEFGLSDEPAFTEGARAEVLRLVKSFWMSSLAKDRRLVGAAKEVPFLFERGGVLVNGVIDLLIRDQERWHIVDYKTNLLGEGGPEEAFAPYELQARIYALAALEGGAAEVELSFVFLQRAQEPVVRLFGRPDLSALRASLDEALAGLLAGDYPRSGACAGCEQDSLCRDLASGEDRWNPPPPAWTPPAAMV
jgi:ATP-dependent exoDNAse (exonuclease V) beta subunit